MPRYKAIIFDLDGTLCYTFDDIVTAMNEMLGVLGYPLNTPEHILDIINNGSKNLVRKAMPESAAYDERLFDEAYALYDVLYALHCQDRTTLYDGIAEMLSLIKASGLKIAVHTNKQDSQSKMMLRSLLPEGTFDMIVGAGIYPVKPDPTAPLAIAAKMGASPAETVFCGDSEFDMMTAHNAGMFALGVDWGYRARKVLEENGAGIIVSRPSDIADFLLK